jgi:hypothetical protein
MFSFGFGRRQARIQRDLDRNRKTGRQGDYAFHPRLEALEGRALPSVSHLSLTLSVFGTINNSPFTFVETIRIDFTANPTFVNSPAPQAASPPETSSAGAGIGSVAQTPVVTSNVLGADNSGAASLRSGLPTAVSTGSDAVPLIAFTNVATAARPVTVISKPSLPETPILFSTGFMGQVDQPVLINVTLLPKAPTFATVDPRAASPIVLPVQAITNRIEFMGGSGAVADTAPEAASAPETAPAPRPVDPPPPSTEELAPLGGMLGLPLEQAVLTSETWLPDAMVLGTLAGQEGEAEPVLSPALASEAAALALYLGNLRIGSPAEIAAQRGKRRGVMQIIFRKEKSGQ